MRFIEMMIKASSLNIKFLNINGKFQMVKRSRIYIEDSKYSSMHKFSFQTSNEYHFKGHHSKGYIKTLKTKSKNRIKDIEQDTENELQVCVKKIVVSRIYYICYIRASSVFG